MMFFLKASSMIHGRKSTITTTPKGPIFNEDDLVTYIQKIDAFPNDIAMKFAYFSTNSSQIFLSYKSYMVPLFEIPLLKENGRRLVSITHSRFAEQYSNVTVERRNHIHIVSFKIRLTCRSSHTLNSRVTTKSAKTQLQEIEQLANYGFKTARIGKLSVQKKNGKFLLGDKVKATCEIKECISLPENVNLNDINEQLEVSLFEEETTTGSEFVHSMSNLMKPFGSEMILGTYKYTGSFVAHCTDLTVVCSPKEYNRKSALKKVKVGVDTRFCKSSWVLFAFRHWNGSLTDEYFIDIRKHDSWQVLCKAIVNKTSSIPKLVGPFNGNVKIDSKEIAENRFIVESSAKFIIKDCSMYGKSMKCSLDQRKTYTLPILPKICATKILGLRAEIYNFDSEKRTIYSSTRPLGQNEVLVIICDVRVPQKDGIRSVKITDGKRKALKVKTTSKVDSLKRYLLVLEATISRDIFEMNRIHNFTCQINHAWPESGIDRDVGALLVYRKKPSHHIGLLITVGIMFLIFSTCLLDLYTTRFLYRMHTLYQRNFCRKTSPLQRYPFMKMEGDEVTLFEQATAASRLL